MFDAIMMMLVGVVITFLGSFCICRYCYMHWWIGDWSKWNTVIFILGLLIMIIVVGIGSLLTLIGIYDYNLIKGY